MSVRKILVPTDFSPASAHAVTHAVALASQCNASLTVLHVVDINTQAQSGSAQTLMKTLWEKGVTNIKDLVWSLSNRVGVQTMLEEGLPWEVIVEASHNFDLLVLGRSHSERRMNLFSQHTGQRVLENSCCPVMVLRNQF
jgi:nucleotide-binding universal stress UspA family protein